MAAAADKVVRIGCHSGFWGDSLTAAQQLVELGGRLDYLVSDYLAEVTMCILARAKSKGAAKGGAGEGGYVAEFVDSVWRPLMKPIMARNIKVITNAGGMNPVALKEAIERAARDAGVPVPVVAAVVGDDLQPRLDELRPAAFQPFAINGEPEALLFDDELPVLSCNAYLGARPIAEALARGAQIVVTGRGVDSAVVLGPLLHEFGWRPDVDYDRLSAGSLAGHIIECGCQATGGNYTDWRESAARGWHNTGYPIVEVSADGSFVVMKPDGTGGLVNRFTVAEQLLYEIHDPAAYVLPDVVCDWSHVDISALPAPPGAAFSDRVRVSGARGRAPTPFYKVAVTAIDGYRIGGMLMIGGVEAASKAQAVAEAALRRLRLLLERRRLPDFVDAHYEVLGAEHTYGPHARTGHSREVLLRLAVHHRQQAAVAMFAKELASFGLCSAPGMLAAGDGRPSPSPLIRYSSCLISKQLVPVAIHLGGSGGVYEHTASSSASVSAAAHHTLAASVPAASLPAAVVVPSSAPVSSRRGTVPLIALCLGRSGDKGDTVNIGLIVRRREFFALVHAVVTEQRVAAYMAHRVHGSVRRYLLPGIGGLNFVCTRALGGGGTSSLRIDRQGKAFAQMLLDMPIVAPLDWLSLSKV